MTWKPKTSDLYDDFLTEPRLEELGRFIGLRHDPVKSEWVEVATGETLTPEFIPHVDGSLLNYMTHRFREKGFILEAGSNALAGGFFARYAITFHPEGLPPKSIQCEGYMAPLLTAAITGAAIIALITLKSLDERKV